MKNVEIYKESNVLTTEEVNLINNEDVKILRSFKDIANGYIAFHLDCDRGTAEEIVDKLNEINLNSDWFLGDENEEYVYVN